MPLTIGDFARLGGVSARMLRHYDRLGLLHPERTDDASGYRYYTAAQLTRLNRLVALRDLGFTLEAIGALLDADPEQTREQLVDRRAALAAAIETDRQRLAAVDARLALLDDTEVSGLGFVEKPLPDVRVAQLSGAVEDAAELGARVGPMFAELVARLDEAGVPTPEPSYAWYETRGDLMHFDVGFRTAACPGVERHDLSAHPRGLTVVHEGEIGAIGRTWQAVAREADARGLSPAGPGREVYHATPQDRPGDWVVEVQLPVASA